MTSKLTITDERLAELVAFKPLPGTDINSATRDEWMAMAAELQERRTAERDSEPVAWRWRWSDDVEGYWRYTEEPRETRGSVTVQALYRHAQPGSVVDNEPYGFTDGDRRGMIYEPQYADRLNNPLPVYRHAQPAPVVPEEKPMPNPLRMHAVDAVAAIAEVKGWNACRAAMLQAGNSPVIPDTWIPVSERMPEKNGTYQVWNGKHVGAVPFLFGSFQCLNPGQVTHWMPTARPPLEMKP